VSNESGETALYPRLENRGESRRGEEAEGQRKNEVMSQIFRLDLLFF